MNKFKQFKVERISNSNYEALLSDSRNVFYSKDQSGWIKFLERYSNASRYKEIQFCSLEVNKKVIASCTLIKSELNINGELVPFYFLTQVITAIGFRGKGFFRELLEKVEAFVLNSGVSILIVIARRAVSDLYWKLGFNGFSHFPVYTKKFFGDVNILEFFRPAVEGDLSNLHLSHLRSNQLSNSKIIRSETDWQRILNEQASGKHKILLLRNSLNRNYLITRDNRVIELSSYGSTKDYEEFFLKVQHCFSILDIGNNHPVSRYLDAKKWTYSERFEPREGHLLKIIGPISQKIECYLGESKEQFGKYRLEISEVDQW